MFQGSSGNCCPNFVQKRDKKCQKINLTSEADCNVTENVQYYMYFYDLHEYTLMDEKHIV